MDDLQQLGGNIELSGFREMDGASMIILKKIIGNYAKRFGDLCKDFQKLSVHMKSIHQTEGSEKYEIHVNCVDGGQKYSSEDTDRNLFIVVDNVLKKVENEIQK